MLRTVRVLIAVGIVAASVFVVLVNRPFRTIEAWMASWILAPFSADRVGPTGDVFYVWTDTNTLIGLQVTIECTVLILGIPLMIFAAIMLIGTRVSIARILLGLLAMWVVVVTVNAARLAMIGWATQTWGLEVGYSVMHTFIGSVIGIAGFVAGLAAQFLVMGIKTRSRRR